VQPHLLGLEVDHKEDAREVQESGQDGPDHDLRVGDADHLSHEESGGAHDGGHDLSASGGGGLNGTRELRGIASLLHQGDGNGAGGHGVAHRGTGHHAAQSGRDDGYLGGTAGGGACDGVCPFNEEVGDAGGLQESAEDDEQHDVGAAHADGGANDAVGGVEQVVHNALHRLSGKHGQISIKNEGRGHA